MTSAESSCAAVRAMAAARQKEINESITDVTTTTFVARLAGFIGPPIRLLKNAHLLRFPHPSSLRRTSKYASLLRISGALHLGIFEQPAKNHFFSNLMEHRNTLGPRSKTAPLSTTKGVLVESSPRHHKISGGR